MIISCIVCRCSITNSIRDRLPRQGSMTTIAKLTERSETTGSIVCYVMED